MNQNIIHSAQGSRQYVQNIEGHMLDQRCECNRWYHPKMQRLMQSHARINYYITPTGGMAPLQYSNI